MKLKFNPLSGNFDLVAGTETTTPVTAEAAQKVQVEFDLYGPATVGDLIVPSTIQPDAVEAISTNSNYPRASFGVITAFVTATRVQVLVSGLLSGPLYQLDGLSFGKSLFISSTGKLTTTPPISGPLQKMGIALNASTIFLLPNLDIINRT